MRYVGHVVSAHAEECYHADECLTQCCYLLSPVSLAKTLCVPKGMWGSSPIMLDLSALAQVDRGTLGVSQPDTRLFPDVSLVCTPGFHKKIPCSALANSLTQYTINERPAPGCTSPFSPWLCLRDSSSLHDGFTVKTITYFPSLPTEAGERDLTCELHGQTARFCNPYQLLIIVPRQQCDSLGAAFQRFLTGRTSVGLR